MERVIQAFIGDDGVMRSARVKLAHGHFKRPKIKNRASDVGATSNPQHEPLDNKK